MLKDAELEKQLAACGEHLKKAMEYRNVTVKELAAAIGRSESSVRRYCKGNVNYPSDILLAMCRYLDVLPSYLLGDPIMEKETMDVMNSILKSVHVDQDWDEKGPELLKRAEELTDDQRLQMAEYLEQILKRDEDRAGE